MSAIIIRPEKPQDRDAIRALLVQAFGGEAEARLVDALRNSGAVVLSLVAERNGEIRGHILFSRLVVRGSEAAFPAVALAPLAVHPEHQRQGIGLALMEDAHMRLQAAGERLSVVLGDPAYYGRAGYRHARAQGFTSVFQGTALQALAWGEAPVTGQLEYAPAFGELG
ncbi:N-acetyltransferase [Chelativorans sp. Marseille-P2723]|uniref:GNAT family N-acetyltransferase n=1 Tax=Chelativorans sp. Marseille-P2723 TaxID=2709133 RepID=UPI0015715747|nr:N-acetyltransferase [Chelativorans sp. Marseille-P2723]